MCAAVVVADRGFTWSDEETCALLKFWAAHDPQNNGNKRNFVIYEKISEKMVSLGFNRSTSQCREKIKRMKREYTLTKQFNGTTTGPKKLMRFYEQFEKILLEKRLRSQRNTTLRARALAAAHIECQSPNQWKKMASKRSRSGSRMTKLLPAKEKTPQVKDEVDPWAPAVVLVEGENLTSPANGNCRNSPENSVDGGRSSKKDRKDDNQNDMFQNMMNLLSTRFLDYQEQTDARFLTQLQTLQQEQHKSDENIQKMWLDFEERRKKDEAEHESNVSALFQGLLGQVSSGITESKDS